MKPEDKLSQLKSILTSKDITSVSLHFYNENNPMFKSKEDKESELYSGKKPLDGKWSGSISYSDISIKATVDLIDGTFDEVVQQLKDYMKK